MAEAVVDGLEVVYVEHEHRERPPEALCAAKLALEDLLEVPVVVRAGQRVADRLLAGLVVGARALDCGHRLVREDLERANRLERRRLPVVGLLDREAAQEPVVRVEGDPEQFVRAPAVVARRQHAARRRDAQDARDARLRRALARMVGLGPR
jgi:hypothetical protein